MKWLTGLFPKKRTENLPVTQNKAEMPPESAEHIYSKAMGDMEKMLSGDLDVSPSDVIQRLSKAAGMGHQAASIELQRIGKNIFQIEATDFWANETLRANAGDPKACMTLFQGYDNGEFLGNKLEKSKEKARVWLVKAADLGNTNAQLLLGLYLVEDKQKSEGFAYLKKAAINGNNNAYEHLKRFYPEVAQEVAAQLVSDLDDSWKQFRDSGKR